MSGKAPSTCFHQSEYVKRGKMEKKEESGKEKHRSYIVWAGGGSCSSSWAETFSKVPCPFQTDSQQLWSHQYFETDRALLQIHFYSFETSNTFFAETRQAVLPSKNVLQFNCTFPLPCYRSCLFKMWRYKIIFNDRIPKRLRLDEFKIIL